MIRRDVILCTSFNSDKSLVAMGTHTGFTVYSLIKFQQVYEAEFEGGVGLIAMYGYSNLFALRGSSLMKYEEKNRVTLYDAKKKEVVGVVSYEMPIKAITMTQGFLVVSTLNRIFIYTLSPGSLNYMLEVQTHPNPFGAMDLQELADETHLAVPISLKEFPDKGIVAIRVLEKLDNPTLIRAFKEEIDFLKFDKQMKRLVTYSNSKWMLRVFEILTGKLLQTLVKDFKADIRSMDFSPNNKFLLVCDCNSDLEIFNTKCLESSDSNELNTNRKSMFAFMKNVIPFFKNEWSFATIRDVTANSPGSGYFSSDSQFCVISYSGQFLKYSFDILYGGDCFLEESVSDFIQ